MSEAMMHAGTSAASLRTSVRGKAFSVPSCQYRIRAQIKASPNAQHAPSASPWTCPVHIRPQHVQWRDRIESSPIIPSFSIAKEEMEIQPNHQTGKQVRA